MDDRLIANELQNGSSQSSLACKSCRKRKLKCDRNLPQCQHCQKTGRTCEYPTVAQKPGPRPGTHRRNLDAGRSNGRKTRPVKGNTPHSPDTPAGSDSTTLSHHQPNSALESYSPWQANESVHASGELSGLNNVPAFSKACQNMQISEQRCLEMLKCYLDNMTSFSLFHQPTFHAKLSAIHNTKQMQALLTTMLSFSVRFMSSEEHSQHQSPRPVDILDHAYELTHECLSECRDDHPPLNLLQTLIMQAHMFSLFGVRGRAWRLVGLAIRVAYELRLHELDLDVQDKIDLGHTPVSPDTQNWILVEEKRRAWWAAWECDVFASTILRLPNTIDWTRNRTNLPSSDEDWFNGTPQRSCHLNIDPNRRWRDIRDSGNTCPQTWFILLNSYKWEALSATQRIAPPVTYFDRESHFQDHFSATDYKPLLARKREMLENCVRCTMSALPFSLQTDFFPFTPSPGPHPSLSLTRNHRTFMIHLISAVTLLLISRKDLEGGNYVAYPADFSMGPSSPEHEQSFRVPTTGNSERRRWHRVLVISDQMAQMVRNASPQHYKHVNPNAATALWMAAATQLASMTYHSEDIDVDLAQSNIDLLTTTIESFVRFWELPETLMRSLETLQRQLKALPGRRQDDMARDGIETVGNACESVGAGVGNGSVGMENTHGIHELPDLTGCDPAVELSPLDVLQAMDFGAMYNGVENWENLFLDPGFQMSEFG